MPFLECYFFPVIVGVKYPGTFPIFIVHPILSSLFPHRKSLIESLITHGLIVSTLILRMLPAQRYTPDFTSHHSRLLMVDIQQVADFTVQRNTNFGNGLTVK